MQLAGRVGSVLLIAVLSLPAFGGTICIAAFKPAPKDNLPNMSQDTWGPSAESVFTFQVGKRSPTAVHANETIAIKDVAVDRRVLVRVKLDQRPFESFWLNLGKEPNRRVCLWLYPGYWHWINNGWDPKLGCSCK